MARPLEEIGVRITDPIRPGPPDVIPGLLPSQGQLLVAGATDVGKSLVAIEICSALSTEQPLWGQLKPTRKAEKILYVLGEHYNEVIQRLWQLSQTPMGKSTWILGPEQLGFNKVLVAGGHMVRPAVDQYIEWAKGCDFIVFDPLSAFISGVEGENDNLQMRHLLDTMGLIAQSTKASSLILAHQGKPFVNPMTGEASARSSYAIRGASAIEDAATNIFYMNHVKRRQKQQFGEEPVEDEPAEQDELFELVRRKYKGTAPAKWRLVRPAGQLHHKLVNNRRTEASRQATKEAYDRLMKVYPSMTKSELVKMIANVQELAESTVWNHLGV